MTTARALGYALLAVSSAAVGCAGEAATRERPTPAIVSLAPPMQAAPPAKAEATVHEATAEEPGFGESERGDGFAVSETGLGTTDLRLGGGAEAVHGSMVVVHYVGRLDDGKVFDSSRERNAPFTFELGGGRVIPGWDEGVVGMRVGGLRRLIVPPSLAYGARGAAPAIAPDAILEFDIELLELK